MRILRQSKEGALYLQFCHRRSVGARQNSVSLFAANRVSLFAAKLNVA
jgi:hypothetical protein